MDAEPLQNLTEQSGGVGRWLVTVVMPPREVIYSWNKAGKSGEGKKSQYLLVSEDGAQYCEGIYKRIGKEPKATDDYNKAKQKFKKGTIWTVSKVSITKQSTQYLGCSCKVVIDMNTSSFQPVLQSTVKMPLQAAPADDLETLLQCPQGQLVDTIALVTDVSSPVCKETSNGTRLLVDVTIMDDSGTKGAARCKFPAWFPKPVGNAPSEDLALLMDAAKKKEPVAFFNLVVLKEDQATAPGASEHGNDNKKTTLKTSKDKFFFHISTDNGRADRLKQNASVIAGSTDITVVSEMPTFERTPIDYLTMESTFTVCRLLAYAIQAGGSLMTSNTHGDGASEHGLFQINHARIVEPKGNEDVFALGGERLFPSVQVIDTSGALVLKMREKAALELSGQTSAKTFAELASKGALNFPILCSLRVRLRRVLQSTTATSEDAPGDTQSIFPEGTEDTVQAMIVEATEQDLSPQAMPNVSMDFLTQMLRALPSDEAKMLVAPIADVRHIRHVGMIVETGGSTRLKASCVLTLVAHIGRSSIKELPNGNKLVSKEIWNIPFFDATEDGRHPECGAPEHADKRIIGELASYCTNDNVQDYTLTSRRPKEPVYAVVIISSVQEVSGVTTYMVDKVNAHMIDSTNISSVRSLFRKLARISQVSESHGKLNKTPEWLPNQTPYTAKKARRLSASPTDDQLQSPVRRGEDASSLGSSG